MVLGDPRRWKIQLNEDGVWAGTPADRVRRGAHTHLDKARELIFAGEVVEAQKLVQKQFMSQRWTRSYQTLADLNVKQSGIDEQVIYRRWLDLDAAQVSEEFTSKGVKYSRRVIASRPDRCVAALFDADQPAAISIEVGLSRQKRCLDRADLDGPVLPGWIISFSPEPGAPIHSDAAIGPVERDAPRGDTTASSGIHHAYRHHVGASMYQFTGDGVDTIYIPPLPSPIFSPLK
jgi:hypothetical protein